MVEKGEGMVKATANQEWLEAGERSKAFKGASAALFEKLERLRVEQAAAVRRASPRPARPSAPGAPSSRRASPGRSSSARSSRTASSGGW